MSLDIIGTLCDLCVLGGDFVVGWVGGRSQNGTKWNDGAGINEEW